MVIECIKNRSHVWCAVCQVAVVIVGGKIVKIPAGGDATATVGWPASEPGTGNSATNKCQTVDDFVRGLVVEMIGSVKVKNALPLIIQAAKQLKPENKEEDRILLTTILRILPTLTEGGPSLPLAGRDAKELKEAFQAWQQWWLRNNGSSEPTGKQKNRPAWRRKNR